MSFHVLIDESLSSLFRQWAQHEQIEWSHKVINSTHFLLKCNRPSKHFKVSDFIFIEVFELKNIRFSCRVSSWSPIDPQELSESSILNQQTDRNHNVELVVLSGFVIELLCFSYLILRVRWNHKRNEFACIEQLLLEHRFVLVVYLRWFIVTRYKVTLNPRFISVDELQECVTQFKICFRSFRLTTDQSCVVSRVAWTFIWLRRLVFFVIVVWVKFSECFIHLLEGWANSVLNELNRCLWYRLFPRHSKNTVFTGLTCCFETDLHSFIFHEALERHRAILRVELECHCSECVLNRVERLIEFDDRCDLVDLFERLKRVHNILVSWIHLLFVRNWPHSLKNSLWCSHEATKIKCALKAIAQVTWNVSRSTFVIEATQVMFVEARCTSHETCAEWSTDFVTREEHALHSMLFKST